MTIAANTTLMHWISPTTLRALGWALLHFVWQGTALAALAATGMASCRRPSGRYIVGVAALALMLLTPAATFVYSSQRIDGDIHSTKQSPIAIVLPPFTSKPATSRTISFSPTSSRDALPILVEIWLLGVCFFSLRTAGGFFLLERERRRQLVIARSQILEICYTLQDRLGIQRAIQYCECVRLQTPAVIGWFRPIVLLPVTALTGLSEDQLRSVIVHELAHIKRLDPFVNVFQIWVETLLFYHPAVWWLNKRIRAEREHCCDEMSVSMCGNAVEYARALTLMEEWRSAPGLAMAANRGPLTDRVVRLLGLTTGAGRGAGLIASVLCLTAALFAGNALLGIARPKAQVTVFAQSVPRALSMPAQTSATQPSPSSKPSPSHTESGPSIAGSYIEQMKAAGLKDLSIDQLIAMKIQDVTPEYVHGLREQGVNPDPDRLIAMRVQEITPGYIQELRQAGLNPTPDQLIALKVQGANGQYYQGLKQAGIEPDVDRLIALKVQGVTPEYVSELRAAGLTVTADQVIALKVQNVTPAYLKGLHEQGIDPRTDDAIAMRVQDVTPEYVREMHTLGLKPSASDLIAMRVQEVTPEYVKVLQSAGFKVDVREIISAKVQDVTPEFIERAREHGFKDLTLQKLIQLRQLGILDSKADI